MCVCVCVCVCVLVLVTYWEICGSYVLECGGSETCLMGADSGSTMQLSGLDHRMIDNNDLYFMHEIAVTHIT